jgi:hypothetical protein
MLEEQEEMIGEDNEGIYNNYIDYDFIEDDEELVEEDEIKPAKKRRLN